MQPLYREKQEVEGRGNGELAGGRRIGDMGLGGREEEKYLLSPAGSGRSGAVGGASDFFRDEPGAGSNGKTGVGVGNFPCAGDVPAAVYEGFKRRCGGSRRDGVYWDRAGTGGLEDVSHPLAQLASVQHGSRHIAGGWAGDQENAASLPAICPAGVSILPALVIGLEEVGSHGC